MTQRFLFLLCFFGFGLSQFADAQTIIFNSSPSAQPGEAVSLQGNFGAGAKAYLIKGASASQVLLPILVQSESQATVQIPANLGLDLYQIWINDNGQNSPKVFVNRPNGMHFDTPDVYPDGPIRIFGLNLKLNGGIPRVRFVAPNGTSLEGVVNASLSDAYVLSVKAPANLQPGTVYTVWVNNGFGGTVGDIKMEKKITAVNPGTDYFKLGVGWASKLDFYRNVYNVKTDSRLSTKAVGDGNTNDYKAIRNAIQRANADGGGIVYLPAGTYKLVFPDNFEGIRMMKRVVIQGAGKDQTIINFGYDTDQNKVGVYWPTEAEQAGIADLSLMNVDNSGNLINNMRGQGKEIFLQRIRFDLNNSNWIWLNNSEKLVIANSDFTQGVDSQYGYRGPIIINGSSYFVINNNSFTYAVDGLNLNSVHEGVFENNRVYRDGSARYPTSTINHVLILNFAENVAVINNLFKVINGPPQDRNDGETIIAEGGGATRPDEDSGVVSSASATTLQDNAKNWAGNVQTPVVAIVNGKGMGQWRTITSRKGNTLNLDRPWDVVPAAGSRYAIFNWGARNWLLKENKLEGNRRGITLYKNATLQVAMVNNTLINSGSIDITPSQQLRGSTQTFIPAYNNQIVGNSVSNTNGANGVFIGVHPIQHAQEKTFGTAVIGLEMRNNTLTAGRPNVGAIVEGDPYPEGYLNYLEYHSPGKPYFDEQIPSVLGSILENNTATNSNNALLLNSGSYNTYVCNLRLVNSPNLLDDVQLDKVSHASVRTTSCTPITPQLAVNVGADRTITLPTNSLSITATATSAPIDNIASMLWTKISGPNPAISGINTLTLALSKLVAGTYVFRMTVIDKQNKTVSDDVTITVKSVTSTPPPTTENPPTGGDRVVSFSLMNADTDKEIKVLAAGETLNLATLPTRNLNIRANTNPSLVGSVVMQLSGRQSRTQTETGAPYALHGDTDGNYKNWTPSTGNYSLTVTPYTEASGKGTAGTPLTLSFSVIDKQNPSAVEDAPVTEELITDKPVTEKPASGGDRVVSFSLMNADTDKEIKVLAAGETLNLATLPTRNLNIRANTNPGTVGSVVMQLSGRQSRTQTETGAPYALFADTNGDYRNWTPSTGTYSLTVTPYTQASGKGTAGTPLTLSFTVVSQAPAARLSVDNPEMAQITYYPNPFTESFTLKVPGRGPDKLPVKIYDTQGRIVLELDDVPADELIHVGSHCVPGLYVLQVGVGPLATRHKLLKVR